MQSDASVRHPLLFVFVVAIAPLAVLAAPIAESSTCSLSASVPIGGATTLSWTTTNTQHFSIEGIGYLAPVSAGSIRVRVGTTTAYFGTASGTGGIASCITSVTQPPDASWPACVLSLKPASIPPGGTATLSWQTRNAEFFVLDNGVGTSTPISSGQTLVSVATSTAYSGVVKNGAKTASCAITLGVSAAPPPTCSMSVSRSTIIGGQSVTVSWESQNADYAVWSHLDGSASTNGMQKFKHVGSTTVYAMTFYGNGGTTTCSAEVIVAFAPLSQRLFSAGGNFGRNLAGIYAALLAAFRSSNAE